MFLTPEIREMVSRREGSLLSFVRSYLIVDGERRG